MYPDIRFQLARYPTIFNIQFWHRIRQKSRKLPNI